MGLGTDTGGSVRIPASYCGLAGFKPTQFRVTRDGAFALSETLDSIGPIANTVACCAIVDRIIADVSVPAHPPLALKGMRLGVPQDFVLEGLDVQVAKAFERSLSRLALAGARIEKVVTPHFLEIPSLFAAGTIANAEAFALHTRLGLLERGDLYDPMVRVRIEMAARMSARDLIELHRARTRLVVETARLTSGLDALVLPATANVAPKYADIADAAAFAKVNGLALRNTSLFNFLDRCALSIPMQAEGELPCGLMVVGEHGGDMRLLALGESIEAVLRA
jgi:aspartyl-tRNA(Asn)/glutamyl-tRNA(Gln) amidotransferase subunit A